MCVLPDDGVNDSFVRLHAFALNLHRYAFPHILNGASCGHFVYLTRIELELPPRGKFGSLDANLKRVAKTTL